MIKILLLNGKRINIEGIKGKRSQAALEFMTTYGWAIMIIMLSIATISYFGFIKPQSVLPDKCIFSNGMICQDSLITSSSLNLSIINGLGRTVYNVQAVIDGDSGKCTVDGLDFATVSPDSAMRVDCELDKRLQPGQKSKFKVFLNFTKTPTGYTHISIGEVYGSII
ncbi:MAG: hypothetical protein KatS3mg002_0740 [Candidatus Woesearchaeota archaeon]|nr:MAG: hypothetical protein KatS3mg002_0740 [Candidatus Woesearchaeota archaeon]